MVTIATVSRCPSSKAPQFSSKDLYLTLRKGRDSLAMRALRFSQENSRPNADTISFCHSYIAIFNVHSHSIISGGV